VAITMEKQWTYSKYKPFGLFHTTDNAVSE
jgi:hypothetical protein